MRLASPAGYEEFPVSVGLVTFPPLGPFFFWLVGVVVVSFSFFAGRREGFNVKHVEERGGSVQAN